MFADHNFFSQSSYEPWEYSKWLEALAFSLQLFCMENIKGIYKRL